MLYFSLISFFYNGSIKKALKGVAMLDLDMIKANYVNRNSQIKNNINKNRELKKNNFNEFQKAEGSQEQLLPSASKVDNTTIEKFTRKVIEEKNAKSWSERVAIIDRPVQQEELVEIGGFARIFPHSIAGLLELKFNNIEIQVSKNQFVASENDHLLNYAENLAIMSKTNTNKMVGIKHVAKRLELFAVLCKFVSGKQKELKEYHFNCANFTNEFYAGRYVIPTNEKDGSRPQYSQRAHISLFNKIIVKSILKKQFFSLYFAYLNQEYKSRNLQICPLSADA